MDWPLAFLIVSLAVTLLGFLWGVIKAFKKPPEDKSWEEPVKEFKVEITDSIKEIEKEVRKHGILIHDLEKDKDIINGNVSDLKNDIHKVSEKCDAILSTVIEYMKKD